MTFAAPWFLAAGAVAAAVAVMLHLFARREPRPWSLPTARFVPETPERTAARSIRLSDRGLLALRLTAIALAALGFARPSRPSGRDSNVRVIVVDSSHAADSAAVARAVAEWRRPADRVVTAVSLSAGLLAAIDAARALRDEADTVAIILISPLVRDGVDAATLAIRATWPGGIEWRAVAAAVDSTPLAATLLAGADDPIRAALSLGGIPLADSAPVRLVREARPTADDSAWAARGRRLVHWPTEPIGPGDTIGAVITATTVVVAAFSRSADPLPLGTPIAWWVDGRTAATERPLGAGCVRTVAIPVSPIGDFVLEPRFRDLVRDLLAPCRGHRDHRPVDSATRTALLGSTPSGVATRTLPPRPDAGRELAPWLLGLALVVLLTEHLARREPAR